jgi:polyphosphate glucokinase
MANVIGIDIGGSGIKGAVVDTQTGEFSSDRVRIETPKKSTPHACAKVIRKILEQLGAPDDAPIGVAMPAPVVHGKIPMIANLDKEWLDLAAEKFLKKELKRPVAMVNDADAAGLAEVYCGAAKDHDGIVIVTTLGTGIGSAVINNGVLLPNTELGHLEIDGHDAESRASAGVRDKEELSYHDWAKRLDIYYRAVEKLFWPDLFVVGGGVSKNHKQFLPLLHLRTPIIPATLRNRAGIVGAALTAESRF